jgi:hypothetical protein
MQGQGQAKMGIMGTDMSPSFEGHGRSRIGHALSARTGNHMMNSLIAPYTAVVLGASGALGQALVAHLKADGRCGKVLCLSRHSTPGFELEDEASVARCASWLRQHGPLHLVLDATGALTLDGQGPEKRLDHVDVAQLARAMQVNAIGPTLLLRTCLRFDRGGMRKCGNESSLRQ